MAAVTAPRGRVGAAGVVAIAVGFWATALGLIALLVWAGFGILAYAPDQPLAGFAAWGLAGALAFGFVPRLSSDKSDPTPPLSLTEHPRLHALVREVAHSTGGRAPDSLYLAHDVNAFAGVRRARVFARRESVVGIGLPLLAVLTETEVRSVLAHEMGHHIAGDVRLGPWVHRTRVAIGRAVDRLEGSSFWLHLPFVAYAELFMKASMRVSRAQELAADALASTVAGPSATASALRKTDVIAAAWSAFFRAEVVPVLAAGRVPPLLEGWNLYWLAAQTPGTPAFEALEAALEVAGAVDERDTHPPLRERIEALGDPPPHSEHVPLGLSLLDDVPVAEAKALRDLLVDGARTTPIAWDDVSADVWLPAWRASVAAAGSAIAGLRPTNLPHAFRDWERIAAATRRGPAVTSALAEKRRVERLLAITLVVRLADAGWRIEARPGHAVRAHRGDGAIEPFALASELFADRDEPRWARTCAQYELA
jgi:Zn-dependent protease with chaperone function